MSSILETMTIDRPAVSGDDIVRSVAIPVADLMAVFMAQVVPMVHAAVDEAYHHGVTAGLHQATLMTAATDGQAPAAADPLVITPQETDLPALKASLVKLGHLPHPGN